MGHGIGTVDVCSSGLLGMPLARVVRLPRHGNRHAEFRLATRPDGSERWHRTWKRMQGAPMPVQCTTTVRWTADGFVERRGPLAMVFTLTSPQSAKLVQLRLFGFPLPGRGGVDIEVASFPTRSGISTVVDITIGSGRVGRLTYTVALRPVGPGHVEPGGAAAPELTR